ncbi:Pyruvate phosphate dikinase, PEP/pyruvate binding domain [Streptomyces sp. 2323.1]|uniref:PEP/pyruvate-binding domain-containing protein n=1 Tax=Streptomyces sp. 2323.1 TaxID=1938841 RepID=UPI000BB83303|nr:PEP/pyruvate-binding domain-containing protein [Streptomyces sp. 2323.1]SOE09334.1 Pyruvate phosphate dikinase, PEP/pyruvate binding domain [Streptomyces sp. 2323.1]
MTTTLLPSGAPGPVTDRTVIGENLSLPLFRTLSGVLAGHPYLKVVVDRTENTWHLLDTAVHPFHVNYIATRVLGMDLADLDSGLDAFNASVYMDPERRFLLGVLSLHTDEDAEGRERPFLVLETTEADTMNGLLLEEFYTFVRHRVDGRLPLLLKPANHGQEHELAAISDVRVPRILGHELFGNRTRTPLNPGEAVGRLRYFRTPEEYAAVVGDLGWSDIVAMPCLPDDVPRVAGFLNTAPGTPLSHTNVLASGWGIPNAIVRDLDRLVEKDGLDGAWIRYRVQDDEISLVPLAHAPALDAPTWHQQRIRMEPPLLEDVPALALHRLRRADHDRYGTKAANLGELHHVLDSRSADLTAFYGQPRPPRAHLYGHLAARLGVPGATVDGELRAAAADFVSQVIAAPQGIALPFALQHRFLTSSPAVQQGLGKLKMALELDAVDVLDSLCLHLQHLIRNTPMPEDVTRQITLALPDGPAAGSRLVIRSSSNAEDLPGFSAAGVYDSITTVHGAEELLDAVRQVWASLLSPRSVRLRHQAGISLDDTYMGVIIQQYVPADLGGVLVTCNPTRREDFRNVYLNCSPGSPETVVDGTTLPLQYLYNTVEGGGRTVALGSTGRDLPDGTRDRLAQLALAGRLLQSHFSDADVDHPLDIEWLMTDQGDFRLVQIRPYAL